MQNKKEKGEKKTITKQLIKYSEMELYKALKFFISENGRDLLSTTHIINHLNDNQCLLDKPATKLMLRDIINSGCGIMFNTLMDSLEYANKDSKYVVLPVAAF